MINELKIGLSSGVDFISNEMLRYSMSAKLLNVLTDIFNKKVEYGHVPYEFNTSLLTPIPKNGNELNVPKDYRPFSVSTVFVIIFKK